MTTTAQAPEDPKREFYNRVSKLKEDGATHRQAVNTVCRQDPELHKAYLKACNPGSLRGDSIDQRFGD